MSEINTSGPGQWSCPTNDQNIIASMGPEPQQTLKIWTKIGKVVSWL